MRFRTDEVVLAADHPMFAELHCWKIFDEKFSHYELGIYMSEAQANKFRDKLEVKYGC